MLGVPIGRLLKPAASVASEEQSWSGEALELRARIMAARAVDQETVSLLQQKLDMTRVIDRRLGASALLGELRAQISQMRSLLGNVLDQPSRVALARVLVDASTLAGWQSLDHGLLRESWEHYDQARSAARVAESSALEAYACAGQAVVLLDIGEPQSAVELTRYACAIAEQSASGLLASWLLAGHGEALAAAGDRDGSFRAFDRAEWTMSTHAGDTEAPYLVFDGTHLARWRGSALARLGEPEAVDVLSDVLGRLSPDFARAESALRVDLVQVLSLHGERHDASIHAERAEVLAAQVGSVRQRQRLKALAG
ncbi:tetratricopeptide repeat protein [Actinosynnema sp. CS-041913]|uniref:tetratricopeptide repeat protein n=1 Tax=Actinosynnema sp. CS-041913 TaxID=3239917 RepID=UPI003D8E26CB